MHIKSCPECIIPPVPSVSILWLKSELQNKEKLVLTFRSGYFDFDMSAFHLTLTTTDAHVPWWADSSN